MVCRRLVRHLRWEIPADNETVSNYTRVASCCHMSSTSTRSRAQWQFCKKFLPVSEMTTPSMVWVGAWLTCTWILKTVIGFIGDCSITNTTTSWLWRWFFFLGARTMKQIWFVVATGSFGIGARRQVTQIECLSYMVINSPRRRMILAISRKSTVQVWFEPRRFGKYWMVPQSLEATEGIDWISIHTIMNIFNSLFYSWAQEKLHTWY